MHAVQTYEVNLLQPLIQVTLLPFGLVITVACWQYFVIHGPEEVRQGRTL